MNYYFSAFTMRDATKNCIHAVPDVSQGRGKVKGNFSKSNSLFTSFSVLLFFKSVVGWYHHTLRMVNTKHNSAHSLTPLYLVCNTTGIRKDFFLFWDAGGWWYTLVVYCCFEGTILCKRIFTFCLWRENYACTTLRCSNSLIFYTFYFVSIIIIISYNIIFFWIIETFYTCMCFSYVAQLLIFFFASVWSNEVKK